MIAGTPFLESLQLTDETLSNFTYNITAKNGMMQFTNADNTVTITPYAVKADIQPNQNQYTYAFPVFYADSDKLQCINEGKAENVEDSNIQGACNIQKYVMEVTFDNNLNIKVATKLISVYHPKLIDTCNNGFDCIVTHHPFIFSPLSRINSDVYGIFKILMDAGISVLSYHTRMDSAVGGVNDCLAEVLNLNNIAAFGGESGNIGRVGELSEQMSPEEFANFLKEKLHCGNIRAAYFDDENKKIKRVAVVGGGGKSFLYEAFCAGADAFVTSEAAHNTFYDAKKLGMCVYDCGHYYTENQICRRFEQILKDNFGDSLEVYSFDTGSPYINI